VYVPPEEAPGGRRALQPAGACPPYQGPWFPLRSNQVSGVRWRGRLSGPVLSVAGLRPSLALFVYDVFWLLSFNVVAE
jgi:hypothetical protein